MKYFGTESPDSISLGSLIPATQGTLTTVSTQSEIFKDQYRGLVMIRLGSTRSNACASASQPARVAPRREVIKAFLVLPGMMLAGPALARDAEAAKAAAEERKRKLREAAHASAETGTDHKVFGDSNYMVGEEARTPNVHSRQEEGPRTQVNV
eukprot:jgi/Ulvmu1/6993/UM033_0051.1